MPALHFSYSDDLTELEAAALDYLIRTLRPGFCPSREEISQAVGLGRRGYQITKLLDSLVEKGFLRLEPGRFRAITVLRRPDGRRFSLDTLWAPLVGQIVASKPLPVGRPARQSLCWRSGRADPQPGARAGCSLPCGFPAIR